MSLICYADREVATHYIVRMLLRIWGWLTGPENCSHSYVSRLPLRSLLLITARAYGLILCPYPLRR